MNVLIDYDGNKISVPNEVAEFLEKDSKKMSALSRQDRRYLSKSSFELVSGFVKSYDEDIVWNTVSRNLSLKNLQKEILKLSLKEQAMLYYRFYEDMTLEKIGKLFNISKMAVSKRLKKIIIKLKSSVK